MVRVEEGDVAMEVICTKQGGNGDRRRDSRNVSWRERRSWGWCRNWRINLLKTKRNLLYIRNQFIPRSKLFSPQLYKPIS